MDTITCTKCNEAKPTYLFSRDGRKRNGFQSHCKACNRTYYEAEPRRPYLNHDTSRIEAAERRIVDSHPKPTSRLREKLMATRQAEREAPNDHRDLAPFVADVEHRANRTKVRTEMRETNYAANRLADDPLNHDERTADQLYWAWERHQKQSWETKAEMDARFPIIERDDWQQSERMCPLYLSEFDAEGGDDWLDWFAVGVVS